MMLDRVSFRDWQPIALNCLVLLLGSSSAAIPVRGLLAEEPLRTFDGKRLRDAD